MDNMYLLLLLLLLVKCGFSMDIDSFYKYLKTNSSSSSAECETQKDVFLEALQNRDTWAMRMLDSYGRIPQAITQGNYIDFGTYDQCVDIFENLEIGVVEGKYCYGGLILSLTSSDVKTSNLDVLPLKRQTAHTEMVEAAINTTYDSSTILLMMAACVPNACLPSDFFNLASDSICQTKNETRSLDASDIACLIFFGLILLFMVASVIYDVYLEKHSKVAKHKILLAFSAYTNGKKMIKTSKQAGQILFFNGLKVLSMFWVITYHRYNYYDGFAINKLYLEEWHKTWYSFYGTLAAKGVETFFFVGGALMSYIFLKTNKKRNQNFNVFMYYLHRYLRLTPAMAVLFFFQVTVARRIGAGPLYKYLFDARREPCINYWWSFFLYIQNYANADDMCLQHTWYLSIDMQLFILSPLLLLPMIRHEGKVLYIVIPTLVSIVTAFMILFVYFYEPNTGMYTFSLCAGITPWLIGLAVGVIMYKYQNNTLGYRIKNRAYALCGWAVTFVVMSFIVSFNSYASYEITKLWSSIYFPIQKLLWAICLSWVSFACLDGYGGFVNWFLSLPIFQVLSKITYSTYLIHVSLLMIHFGTERTLPYFSDYNGIRHSIADIFVCSIFGALWTLAFESPMLVIEKVIFGRGETKKLPSHRNEDRKKEEFSNSRTNNA